MKVSKGIFWLIDGELLTVKVDCDESGMAHYRASVKNKNPQMRRYRKEK